MRTPLVAKARDDKRIHLIAPLPPLTHRFDVPRYEGPAGANAPIGQGKACPDGGKAARFSAPVPSTVSFDHLLLAAKGD